MVDFKIIVCFLGLLTVGKCLHYNCLDMLPGADVEYQLMTNSSIFMLHIVGCNPHCAYRPGEHIAVFLRAKTPEPENQFTSFVVKARLPAGGESTGTPVGTWKVKEEGHARVDSCNTRKNAVVRNINEDPLQSVELTWIAPSYDDSPGTVEFVASAMTSGGKVWMFTSVLLEENHVPIVRSTSTPKSTSGPPTPPSTTRPPPHEVPDSEKEGANAPRDDDETSQHNTGEETQQQGTGEDPNEPEEKEAEEMEAARRHDEEGPEQPPTDQKQPQVDADNSHDLDKEDEAYVKWQETQQKLLDDEDQNSEGWQAADVLDKQQRDSEYKWEMEAYEKNKYQEESQRDERIRAEIMDKEEHDHVEATRRPSTTTTNGPHPPSSTTHVPRKDNELNPIDNNEVDIDGNGIKLGNEGQTSGTSRTVYSIGALLATLVALLM